MFWVVYFEDLKKNVIVPKQWIKDIKLHKEKFYNNSLNSAQTFTCFHTQNPVAFDDVGWPMGSFAPNFDAKMCTDYAGEGLYRIKLKAYRGNYEKYDTSCS